VKKVFAPEHGFRGHADAGEKVEDAVDFKTGVPVISLYGDHKKPTPNDLEYIDTVVFDIQDVGVRFYTYISTLHYVMEACAENNIPLILLDRPNPNRHYIDGPVLKNDYKSFVGMHPVPVVYGLTIGEYALMINGENWLKNQIKCELKVIALKNYKPDSIYELPVRPSPNLPNTNAVNLYPSLCFFEGTNVNAGRGTDFPFQVYGSPHLNDDIYTYSYVPQPNNGSKYPKHQGEVCLGQDLRTSGTLSQINLDWLLGAYEHTSDKNEFFNSFFPKLAGNSVLQQQIISGLSAEKIRVSWTKELEVYGKTKLKYELY